jgi:hypothetical protein
MLHLGKSEYDQSAFVWEITDKGSYALVKMSTSRKDKESGEYISSNWSFVRFVGKAKNITEVEPKTRIVIKSGGISQEPYMKDGEKTYPKNPQIVVFAWDYPEDNPNRNSSMDTPPTVEDDMPF